MTTIAIFGVGLMGGSLALCFKGKPGFRVVGHSPRQASVDKYVSRGVVDHATTSMAEAAADADFIFLCVPVGSLEAYMLELQRLPLKEGCIVTDVGSTKGGVVAVAERLTLRGAHFIGGHPMAGGERSGVEAASSHLYENAIYVLTPLASTPESAYAKLAELLQHTKAQIIRVEAGLHDRVVGAISHLPHVIAAALVNQVRVYDEADPLYSNLAAGGFRDITRIASSDPELWRDILLSNRDVMLRLIDDWNDGIERFRRLIETADGEGIEAEFRRSREFRSGLPERRKGILTAQYDIYIDVPDHPGIIGSVASLLGNERINLSNIQIIESREDTPGVLRLSFRSQADLDRATAVLKPHYAVHV
ncbi:prephenate dehydrogenase [Paenibacillus cymbidii]|uniref:prephenate dehydrogenase n=1 Tax=Paenibacillus cymbidii TaxID=1639034 RepID=UPI0010817EDA|nr:prephenate dehydrogenase [Paenibacillus cymbidii]